jgi:hypothetical protein
MEKAFDMVMHGNAWFTVDNGVPDSRDRIWSYLSNGNLMENTVRKTLTFFIVAEQLLFIIFA